MSLICFWISPHRYCLTEHNKKIICVLTHSLEIRAGIIKNSCIQWIAVSSHSLSLSVVVEVISHKHVIPINQVDHLRPVLILHQESRPWKRRKSLQIACLV